MEENYFDDLFDVTPLTLSLDTPFQLLELTDSFFRTASTTSQTFTGHGPFHTSRSGFLPTLTPRLSTTGQVATAAAAARQQLPANLSLTPQRRPNLHSLLFPATRTELPAARTTTLDTASRYSTNEAGPNSDDYYLNELATQNFSSPSLPSRSPRPSGRSQDNANHSNQRSQRNPAAPSLSGTDILRRADQLVAGPSFNTTQADPRLDLQHPSFPTSEPPDTDMPTGARRKRRSGGASDPDFEPDFDLVEQPTLAGPSRPCPQRRTSRGSSQQQPRPRPVEILDSDDPFGSPSPTRPRTQGEFSAEKKYTPDRKRKRDDHGSLFSDDEDISVVDLVDADKIPESILKQKQKPKNEVKLGTFQCVICMDDCTDLTVTHCGHLFCAECLHTSLHIDVNKKVCPICRQSVETKPANGKFTPKQKGYYHLELKLLTKKTLGRRPASQQ